MKNYNSRPKLEMLDFIDIQDRSTAPEISNQITNRDRLLYTLDIAAPRLPDSSHTTRRRELEHQLTQCIHDAYELDQSMRDGESDFYACLDQLSDVEIGDLFRGAIDTDGLSDKMIQLAILRNPNRPTTLKEIEDWDRQCARDGLCVRRW